MRMRRVRDMRLKGMTETRSSLPIPGPSGCFVYILFFETPSSFSGYVGHTGNLLTRMLDHRHGKAGDKSSRSLFALARESGGTREAGGPREGRR